MDIRTGANRRTSRYTTIGPLRPLLETVIVTRTRPLVGGFKVRRALPSAKQRMVGPFIFLDQMGPEVLRANTGLDVAPHPHIGLATVTYLFDGELLHRDSLGTIQPIRPGEVNWMTAGSGIAHSERTPKEMRRTGSQLFGIQSWVALPRQDEESNPAFAHHGADGLPVIEGEGKRVRLISGSVYGAQSPVQTLSEMFYADTSLVEGARLPIPSEHEERAAYIVEGSVELLPADRTYSAGQLLIFKRGTYVAQGREAPISHLSVAPCPMTMLTATMGGEPMDGARHIWWNSRLGAGRLLAG